MSLIKPLPIEVVNLIAAGEVIDSLAAAVRELVENSLDAGATRITVSLWPQLWRIQVADNGSGIDPDNLQQAAAAHSTSKISKLADIWNINTLGFRGEALHSLAQVADLEILSRPQNLHPEAANFPSQTGWRVLYDHQGNPTEMETVAIAPGTVVIVSNLFGSWPVRRQGLPSMVQQLRSVQLIIQHLALCHPHITWQVLQDDTPLLQISPGANAKHILPQIVRGIRLSDLQSLNQVTAANASMPIPQSLELVLGLPDRCHRRRPDWIKIAMNGRVVRSPEIEQTILSALMRTCPKDRYPVCFIHLKISPDQIDWNRHPAKAEVYLHNLTQWQEQVITAIEQALCFGAVEAANAPLPERVGKLLKASESQGNYQTSRSIQPAAEENAITNQTQNQLIPLKAVAQVSNTYIVVEHPNGVWLVEQHIAHERVLYEQLRANWQLIPLEPAIVLNQLSPAQLEQLQRLGLEVDPFGEQLWAVRNAPALLAQREDCAAALLELSLGGDLEAALVATACRSAIRNGTPLTLSEMQTLLEQWQQCRSPRTCPHGRPICLQLEESALSRFFRRHWVIGKSHGI